MANLPMPVFDKPVRLLIVVAVSGDEVSEARLASAQAKATEAGAEVEVVWVPDVLDVPVAIAMAERLAEFDGYVALSSTKDAVMAEAWRSLSLIGLHGTPIGNGLGSAAEDGAAVAFATLHLVAISRKWAGKTKGIGFRS